MRDGATTSLTRRTGILKPLTPPGPPPGRIARSEKHGRRGRLEITGRIGEALYAVPRTFYCSGAPLPLGGPVVKCLMLAGGAGSRLGARGGLKPLAAVAGLSLV